MGGVLAFLLESVALTYVPAGSPVTNNRWVPSWPAQTYTESDGLMAAQMLAAPGPLYTGSN